MGGTLRVNGRARISVAPGLLARFEVEGTLPSPGAILGALTRDGIDGAACDSELPDRLKTSLYQS